MNLKRYFLAISCAALLGCIGDNGCDASSYPYWSEWSGGRFITIVNDSLAVLAIKKDKMDCMYYEMPVSSRQGLFLVNYRAKQKPLAGRVLSHYLSSKFSIAGGYYANSSVLVFEDNDKFGLWKVGATYVKLNKHYDSRIQYTGLYTNFGFNIYYPWINGNIFVKDYPWRILDTKTGQTTEILELSEENEWLTDCSAISYIEDKIVCIKKNKAANSNSIYNFELVVNGIITDTLNAFISNRNLSADLFGDYMAIIISQGEGIKIHKIDTKNFMFDRTFEPVWIYENSLGAKFYQNDTDFIQYSTQDLIGGELP
jgi:hypothetical protein